LWIYVLVVKLEVEISQCKSGACFTVIGNLFDDSGADTRIC